jgi:myosin heavy subunit
MAHNMYEVGTRAWQPDSTEGWIASEVEEKIVQGDKVKLVFRLANGEVCSSMLLRGHVHPVLIWNTVTGKNH